MNEIFQCVDKILCIAQNHFPRSGPVVTSSAIVFYLVMARNKLSCFTAFNSVVNKIINISKWAYFEFRALQFYYELGGISSCKMIWWMSWLPGVICHSTALCVVVYLPDLHIEVNSVINKLICFGLLIHACLWSRATILYSIISHYSLWALCIH